MRRQRRGGARAVLPPPCTRYQHIPLSSVAQPDANFALKRRGPHGQYTECLVWHGDHRADGGFERLNSTNGPLVFCIGDNDGAVVGGRPDLVVGKSEELTHRAVPLVHGLTTVCLHVPDAYFGVAVNTPHLAARVPVHFDNVGTAATVLHVDLLETAILPVFGGEYDEGRVGATVEPGAIGGRHEAEYLMSFCANLFHERWVCTSVDMPHADAVG
mmetsp:Transcript_942/g.1740  ORF Transcript_942/g.1740 Transcript_942/m.1740 type:complete len:215 (+) Transcript_942:56-700(+)